AASARLADREPGLRRMGVAIDLQDGSHPASDEMLRAWAIPDEVDDHAEVGGREVLRRGPATSREPGRLGQARFALQDGALVDEGVVRLERGALEDAEAVADPGPDRADPPNLERARAHAVELFVEVGHGVLEATTDTR